MIQYKNFANGLANLWEHDEEFQLTALHGIVKHVRRVDDPAIEEMQVNYLRGLGAFYVPDNQYMKRYFGKDITSPSYGIYSVTYHCYLSERLAIPMRLMDEKVAGFIGYSNKPAGWPADTAWIKYRYPGKEVMAKDRYMFIEPHEYKKALEEKYICIVDGLFDKMILQALGINAVSLCGSALTSWHKFYLSFIPHKIVIGDNDMAGRKLFISCRAALANCVEIRQPYTGDIDDFLKDQSRIEVLLRTIEDMKSEGFLLSKTLKEVRKKPSGRTEHFQKETTNPA